MTRTNVRKFLGERRTGATSDFVQEPSTRTHGGRNERIENYTVLRQLGRGGMAEVYLARPDGSNQLVVLKRILPEYLEDERMRDRFLDEASLLSRLSHPNIARMFHLGAANDELFMAMEFLRGVDLQQLIEELPNRTSRDLEGAGPQRQPLPLANALAIVIGAADGLHYAHEQADEFGRPMGIVHRDVSPHNIMLTFGGVPKLIDFGIAKAAIMKSKTHHGAVVGKLQYLSPEQSLSKPVDRRSDVFGLAIVLWELTTGSQLFAGNSPLEVMKKIVDDAAPPPSSVIAGYYPDLEKIVMKGLQRDPNQRYQTALELKQALLLFCRSHDIVVDSSTLSSFMAELYPEQAQIDSLQDSDWARSFHGEPVELAQRRSGASSRHGATRERIILEVAGNESATKLRAYPAPRRRWWLVAVIAALALIAVGGLAALLQAPPDPPRVAQELLDELAEADAQLTSGRLVGPGDNALDHLLAARQIDPAHPEVLARLGALADKFEELASLAYEAGDLPEAAAHLQAALNADPERASALRRMQEIETTVKERQR